MKKIIMIFFGTFLMALFSFSDIKEVRVIVERVSFYSDPKTSSALLLTIKKGTAVNVFGSGENKDWYNVSDGSTSPEKKPEWKRFLIRLGYNAGFATQSASISWAKEIYYEQALFGIGYKAKKGNSFDAALGYRFSRSLGLMIGVDIASRNLNANYDASIPHPLYFNSPREAQNSASYKITENIAFIDLVLTVPLNKFSLDFFAGPAYIFSSAELISAVQYSQSYPYNSITLSAQNQKFSKNVFGANAGVSLIFNFTPSVGVFIGGQYFSGNVRFKPSEVPGLKLTLGGLKAGGGLKISF